MSPAAEFISGKKMRLAWCDANGKLLSDWSDWVNIEK